MGLFSIPVINEGISSLFRGRASKDLVKSRKNESSDVAEEKSEPEVSNSTPSKESEDKGDLDIEDAYMKTKAKANAGAGVQAEVASDASVSKDDDDKMSDNDVQEPEADGMQANEQEKAQDAAADIEVGDNSKIEESERRLEQTIIVKNVPSACITDKKALREFKKLFGPEIESVRFRSIAMSEIVPRKVAFIKQKIDSARDSVNCYIVYKNKDRMHEVLQTLNCTEFMGHHLFVDSAFRPREHKTKQSVFIGNLSFDATEEALFSHFEECGPIVNVRIVRDRKFNIGKGFAYIEFDDPSTVQVALLKNGSKLDGRDLRVQRCSSKKNVPSTTTSKSFRDKQTRRSKTGDPKRDKRKKKDITSASKMVLEGQRAKQGDAVGFGRKRKERHNRK